MVVIGGNLGYYKVWLDVLQNTGTARDNHWPPLQKLE